MAMNRASFEYLGGGAVGGLWRYVTTDNLSTGNVGDQMGYCGGQPVGQSDGSGYWNDAFTYFNVRPYDLIFAINHSSPHVSLWVVHTATSSGVSLICASGAIAKQ